MLDNRILVFTTKLFEPMTRAELVAALPRAFQYLLPDWAWCEVDLEADTRAFCPISSDGRLCQPICSSSSLRGVVTVGWDGPKQPDQEHVQLLAAGAELADVALASREANDADRERARAEAADVRFDLIGMLAHEMRTPLASIKGYASALLLEELRFDPATIREFLNAIDEESDRLGELVTHILDSTVIDAGALELQREPVLLTALIRRTVDSMARRTERHKMIVSSSPDTPPVYADEQRIQQVLINLLDNAIKYSPDGGLILVRSEMRNREVIVQVSDQGIGIAPEHLNKLFERFFRSKQRQELAVSGTGLGLPIAESIVRANGGRIWAESAIDEGTTFTFTLPIVDDDEREASDEEFDRSG